MRILTAILSVLVTILAAAHASATAQVAPLRDYRRLVEPKTEQVYRVKTARIVIADYDLVRKDFPTTRQMSEPEIDRWLLDRAAYISKAQASQTIVNSHIEIDTEAAVGKAYRPQIYGRALVFPADDGLIDVKGTGAAEPPSFASHRSGLASLGEMIREFIFQKKVQQVLEHSGSGLNTNECYAVIDWGFDVYEGTQANHQDLRAGAVLRRAAPRKFVAGTSNHFASPVESLMIEDLLRHYGITSAGDGQEDPNRDSLNIQTTKSGELLDFGAYMVSDHFYKKVYHYMGSYLSGADEIAQPDSRLQLPTSMWGSTVTGRASPRFDNLWVWSHELANNLKWGHAQPSDVRNHFNNFMSSPIFPAELAGQFAGQFTREKINAKEDEFFLQSFKHASGTFGLDELSGFASRNKGVLPEDVRQRILEKLKAMPSNSEAVWRVLYDAQVFEKNPELEPLVLARARIYQPETVDTLITRHKFDLVLKLFDQRQLEPSAKAAFQKPYQSQQELKSLTQKNYFDRFVRPNCALSFK